MKMIDIRGKRILYPLFFIALSCVIIFNVYQIVNNSRDYRVRACKVEEGWGFQILNKKKVFINQPFIPLLTGKKAFPDRKTAVKTGRLLLKRINEHQIPPLTRGDLSRLGVDTVERKP